MTVEREPVGLPAPDLPPRGHGQHPCRGIYSTPRGSTPRTALIAVHYNVDFSEHYLAEPLARRGYGFLGWNTRFCGAEGYFLLDRALVDIAVGVRWLREQGVERLVLLGNSGGGSLMAAYHHQTRDEPDGYPPGDLYVSLAAHPGRPEVLTSWLDPAVLDERDPVPTDPALDMYDPANGPPYEADFLARYRAAQRARNARITEWAKAELTRVRAHGYADGLFTLRRTWADPRFLDPALDPSDRPTPSCYQGDPLRANRGVAGLGVLNTCRTWLSMWSLTESPCRGELHYPTIDLPALVVQATMDSGVFPSDARAILDSIASTDKRLIELPGEHYFREPPGAREAVADALAEWIG